MIISGSGFIPPGPADEDVTIRHGVPLTQSDYARLNGNSPIIVWNNQVSASSLAASSSAAGYPIENAGNPLTSLYWRASSTSDQTITISLDGSIQTEALCIARHNLGTAGATVLVEATKMGESMPTPIVEFRPNGDEPIIILVEQAVYDTFEVTISDVTAAATIAVLFVGPVLRLQRNIYVGHSPLPLSRTLNKVTGISDNGNYLGQVIVGTTFKTSVDQQNLTASWYRRDLKPFFDYAKDGTFFFAWRPAGYPYEVGYCWLTQDPIPVNQRSNGMMQVTIELAGIV